MVPKRDNWLEIVLSNKELRLLLKAAGTTIREFENGDTTLDVWIRNAALEAAREVVERRKGA